MKKRGHFICPLFFARMAGLVAHLFAKSSKDISKREPVKKIGNVRTDFLISLIIFLLIFLVYYELPTFDFNNYDDLLYVTGNTVVQKGLTLSNIYWAFTTFTCSNWHPVTWLSHLLDSTLFGMNPGGHHWTNLVLHSLNSIILFIILLKMTGAAWRSAFVAALFAVHPLHVESVAWVAERKDLLSTLFAFLTIWAYCAYIKDSEKKYYWGAVFLFAIGLMSKPMLVTLPFVLILLDYWPLGRFKPQFNGSQVWAQLREKLPFFVLSVLSSVVTVFAQENAIASIKDFTLPERLGNAFLSYTKYLEKAFWPTDLACFYPYPEIEAGAVVLSIAALFAFTLLAVKVAKKAPYVPFGWFWYLGTLVPVIGIVQVGSQCMADRYTYIPLIGIFIICVWGSAAISEYFRYGRAAIVLCGAAIVLLLGAAANIQASYWKSNKALYTRALNVTSHNYVAQNNIGVAYINEKDYGRAEFHFKEAMKIFPDYASAIYNLGHLYDIQNRLDESIFFYKKFLEQEKDMQSRLMSDAQMNLAMVLLRKGELLEAESVIYKLLSSEPGNAKGHNYYGIILFNQERLEHARVQFEKALSLEPENRHYAFNVQKIKKDIAASLCE